jgi:cytidylate kinase
MARAPLVVAIDGPAGAGKSTAARALATALGYTYLDTGAMYRAVGVAAREARLDPTDVTALASLVDGLSLTVRSEGGTTRVFLGDREVTETIREPWVAEWASRVAAVPVVRERMVARQRTLAATGGVVMDGRDVGTVVFPDAECKFYLTADAEERARRRRDDHRAAGAQPPPLAELRAEIEARDQRDRERAHSPLRIAPDAIVLDTTGLAPDAVVARMLEVVRARARA